MSVTDRRINPQRLERTMFEASRAGEYFDARQLSALAGVPQNEVASVCLKELIDNSLDACETAQVAPEVGVEVARDGDAVLRLSVSDNGPSIPPEVVRKVLDYSIRVSDKAAYRSPTRGAQGKPGCTTNTRQMRTTERHWRPPTRSFPSRLASDWRTGDKRITRTIYPRSTFFLRSCMSSTGCYA